MHMQTGNILFVLNADRELAEILRESGAINLVRYDELCFKLLNQLLTLSRFLWVTACTLTLCYPAAHTALQTVHKGTLPLAMPFIPQQPLTPPLSHNLWLVVDSPLDVASILLTS